VRDILRIDLAYFANIKLESLILLVWLLKIREWWVIAFSLYFMLNIYR